MATITPPLQDRAYAGWLNDRKQTLGRLLSPISLPFRGGASRVSRLFSSGRKKDLALVRQIRAAHEEMGLAGLSDQQLRVSVENQRRHCTAFPQTSTAPQAMVSAFALVDEAIRRRLGSWRILDEAISGSRVTGDPSNRIRDPATAQGAALPDLVNKAIESVQWKGRGQLGPDALLPAQFYRAVREYDVGGQFTFNASDEQLLAALRLYLGHVVEMQAGEGKTLAIAFAAAMHVIQGRSVHIITGNEYLADRDCRLLAPVFRSLGLTCGVILESMERDERRAAYGCEIVYGTLREFGFDYLRDNLALSPGQQVQPPLDVALVDEADQALIDEAAVPLIISGEPRCDFLPVARIDEVVRKLVSLQESNGQELLNNLRVLHPGDECYGVLLCRTLLALPGNAESAGLSRRFPKAYRKGQDTVFEDSPDNPGEAWVADLYFVVNPEKSTVSLTKKGFDWLERELGAFSGSLGESSHREGSSSALSAKNVRRLAVANQVFQSLRAHLLLEKGIDYIVEEGSVFLLDRYTGRVRPDSAFRHGLQPALEARESLSVHPDRESLAQVSVQGFARRYRSLSGITGTALPAAEEFERRYSLSAVAVPTSHPVRRTDLPGRIYEGQAAQLSAIAYEVACRQELGQPVLVGVRSIEQSEALSRKLAECGVRHQVLSAKTSHEEAEIVRAAGAPGAVTVATNLAGRGTDIILADDLSEKIIARSVEAIRRRLSAGRPEVAVNVRVGTTGEAGLMEKALNRAQGLVAERRFCEGGSDFCVTLASGPGEFAGERDNLPSMAARLEVGLGLHVICTQFNRFPRVAMQLRGRSGRQGSFGSTQYMLSLDDRYLFPPGRSPQWLTRPPDVDIQGHRYWQGQAVDKYIRKQECAEDREAAQERSVANDFAAVADLQTAAYYRLRQEIMRAGGLAENLSAVAPAASQRLVEDYFPCLDASDYPARFLELSRRSISLYGLDLADLYGQPLDEMSALVAGRLVESLETLGKTTGAVTFDELVRQVLLECSDEAWIVHQAHLQDTIMASLAALHGHKTAVAEYILNSEELWKEFRSSCRERFLSRLLLFPAHSLSKYAGQGNAGAMADSEIEELIAN